MIPQYPHTIKSLAKDLGVTDMIVIRKFRKLGIKGYRPTARVFYTQEEAEKLYEKPVKSENK